MNCTSPRGVPFCCISSLMMYYKEALFGCGTANSTAMRNLILRNLMTTRKSKTGKPDKVSVKPTTNHSQQLPTPEVINEKQEAAVATIPVVGIGASAGGVEAFEQFFHACPVKTGMAFVLVPHLDPSHDSLLTAILQRVTSMPVMQVLDRTQIKPNHVYIIPPNREMIIFNQVLQLSVPKQTRGQRMPINVFLCSLATDQMQNAIGVILSGTANDGTLGLCAIHAAGGIAMVQEPSTAKYDSMPQNVVTAGCATHVLSVDKMPEMLQQLVSHQKLKQKALITVPEIIVNENDIHQILVELRKVTGHDFSHYKKSTIIRRIERRMMKCSIDDFALYERYIKKHPVEIQVLFNEMLINVTSFFRDPEAFVELKKTILPKLLADKPDDYTFRVWVAGCASGEEAYSIAIVLLELTNEMGLVDDHKFNIQIYATDLDDEAIDLARIGHYSSDIVKSVTHERLRNFFTKNATGYKVKKTLRDAVVFAVQNVIKDPPFTKLDLISCRNLMIYLDTELQNQLIPKFHYSLKPDGVLFLSSSESISNHSELFYVINRKWKLYQAKHVNKIGYDLIDNTHIQPSINKTNWIANNTITQKLKISGVGKIGDLSTKVLLQAYAPTSAITDTAGNILFIYGDISEYLSPMSGPINNNVIEMARDDLKLELRSAILNANTKAVSTINREVLMRTNHGLVRVNLSVRLLSGQHVIADNEVAQSLLLVSFEDATAFNESAQKPIAKKGLSKSSALSEDMQHIEELKRELAYSKENLQASVEEQQAVNEELKSTNEELQSTNEELQSTNEELETSKEELQSLNEETITVNSELSGRVEQLNCIQDDMTNLLDSIATGMIFLDNQLIIRRYTPEAVKIYRLRISDIDRPLSDITSNIQDEDVDLDLRTSMRSVLDTLIPDEREVSTIDGAWYLTRIQPYRTLDNVIAGVVLTFTNVTKYKLISIGLVDDKKKNDDALTSVIKPNSAGDVTI